MLLSKQMCFELYRVWCCFTQKILLRKTWQLHYKFRSVEIGNKQLSLLRYLIDPTPTTLSLSLALSFSRFGKMLYLLHAIFYMTIGRGFIYEKNIIYIK